MTPAIRTIDPSVLNPEVFTRNAAKSLRCHVRPRYSPGSPAMVNDHIALNVADDEKVAHEHALEGAYGEEQQKRAKALGLRGIAYVMAESGSGRKFRWLVYDLITKETFRRLHDNEIERTGFTAYAQLSKFEQTQIRAEGCSDSDYDRTFWKYVAREWVQYEPELVR